MNPLYWLVVALGLFVGGYLKGCTDEKEKFDDFKRTLKAVSEAQENWKAARIVQQQAATASANQAHAAQLAALRQRNSTLAGKLRDAASSIDLVPPNAGAPAGRDGEDTLCFERSKLNRGIHTALDNFVTGITPLLQRGDEGLLAFLACGTAWIDQRKASEIGQQLAPNAGARAR